MKETANKDIKTVEVLDTFNIDHLAKVKADINTNREDKEDGYFICDLGDIVQKHKKWQRIFPRITPFYAMKCNPSEVMLHTMVAMGIGFDCASKSEINQMLRLGADPKKIIFANPCKQSSHIKFAKANGVTNLVFDNEIELLKIQKIYPAAKLVLRIQTDDSASVCRFSMKYGAHPDSCQFLVDKAKSLNLELVGVSFHVGSGCRDSSAFVKALQLAREVFDYGTKLGYNMTLLDIGGGFPGSSSSLLSVEEIAVAVNTTIDALFTGSQFKDLEIIAEPGRYYAASAFTLATNIIGKRKVARDHQSYQDKTAVKDAVLNAVLPTACDEPAYMYYLNDGVYGSFNCLFYDHAEVKPTVLKPVGKHDAEFASSLWGPTCDGLDRILENCALPELNIGDWMIWKDMGAYTVAAGSAFNGFKTSAMYYVITEDNLGQLKEFCSWKDIPNLMFKASDKLVCKPSNSTLAEDGLSMEVDVH